MLSTSSGVSGLIAVPHGSRRGVQMLLKRVDPLGFGDFGVSRAIDHVERIDGSAGLSCALRHLYRKPQSPGIYSLAGGTLIPDQRGHGAEGD